MFAEFSLTIYKFKGNFSSHKRCYLLTWCMHFLPVVIHPNVSSHASASQVQVAINSSS